MKLPARWREKGQRNTEPLISLWPEGRNQAIRIDFRTRIVLVLFPLTDLTSAKLRRALVIYEGEKDVVVAFISSKVPSELSEVDVLVTKFPI